MKNGIIICIITFYPLISFGQNIDLLIRDIRSEYNLIVKNKELYKKTVLYIDHREEVTYNEDGSIESVPEREIEEKITYYIDQNNQIRHISHYSAFSHHFYLNGKLTEYYLKDNNLFFIYQQTKEIEYNVYNDEGYPIPLEDRNTEATEKRIYLTDDVEPKSNCVRYLLKSVEGRFSDINELLEKTTNIETNCSNSTEDVFYTASDLIEIFERRRNVEINNEPTVAVSFYDILFE